MQTIDDKIAEAQNVADRLSKAAEVWRRKLKDLREQQAREAEASKTVGQKLAEQMIRDERGGPRMLMPPPNPTYLWMPLPDDATPGALDCYRRYVAAAIDKAVADAEIKLRGKLLQSVNRLPDRWVGEGENKDLYVVWAAVRDVIQDTK